MPIFFFPMNQNKYTDTPLLRPGDVRVMASYSELVAKYGQAAFSAACAEAKTSPLSVEDILLRNEALKTAAAAVNAQF